MKIFFKGILLSGFLLLPISASFLHSEYLKLKNGINVIFEHRPASSLTAIQIWVSAGAVDEDENNSGISHFIEHMIFKGTKTRTQKNIAPAIEKLGGVINAATSKDFTFFYTIVPDTYCLKAAEILIDAVFNPEFPEKEIEKERKVILEEIKRKDDNPQGQLFDEFYKQVYCQSPYARRVLGTEEVVLKLNRDALLSFHKEFYIPQNIHIIVAGNFNRKEVLNFLKDNPGKLSKIKKRKKKLEALNLKDIRDLPKKTIKRDVAHSYILMGFPAADIRSRDQCPLDLAAYILGTGRASRLYKKFVEETKLAYSISASFSSHKGPGLFYIYAECSPDKTTALSNRILLELLDITINPVTDEELTRAKALLMRDKLLQTQTPDGKAEELGFYAVLGRKKFPENYIKKIKKVKISHIRKVISKYLIFPNIPTVIITP